MRDYDELIKDLRESAEWSDRLAVLMGRDVGDSKAPLMRKAADAIEELLDELTTIRKQLPCWISVEERLPPVYKNVLSCDKYGLVKENYMISDKSWSVGYHITHWMPLPAPPKGVE